ncbi:MAG: hypothetical protein EBR30_04880 [Cytophagia bacterium]|nr:hypothetical protein [Cytophagia bacterium]
MRGTLISALFILLMVCIYLKANTQELPIREKPTFQVVPRINSAGHFPFSGALANKHINFDLNIFFEHKNTGFFIFQSFDLQDRHSIVNYLQPGIFKKFRLTSKVKLGTFFGYVFSQTKGFRDPDSDYFTAGVLYWTINDKLKVENTALFFDLTLSHKLANRLLVTYEVEKFRFDFYVWERIVFESNHYATSGSVAVNFPKIKLSKRLFMQNTISYQGYLTTYKPAWAMRKGLLVSIAFPITLSE